MTREQAIAKLQRILGKPLHWRVGPKLSSNEQRESAKAHRAQVKEQIASVDAEIAEKMKQLGIPELQQMRRELRRRDDALLGETLYFKFEAGRRVGIFISRVECGDTWEEVIAKAEARQGSEKAKSA